MSIVVGLTDDSDSEIAGSSTGKPPACSNAALHVLDALLEMRVALGEVPTRC